MLYKELLDSCNERFAKFFENVKIFHNQFKLSDYNNDLYKLMYENNSENNVAQVKDLKGKVPELVGLCKECANFYMPKRNESIPKYDVILGELHEAVLMEFLASKLGVEVTRADLANRSLPDCKVMKKNGEVAAYLEIKFHGAPFVMAKNLTGRYCYEGSATLDYKKIKKQLELIEELDAPTYYVHWIEYPCLKGIFFESSQEVKSFIENEKAIFDRKQRLGDGMKAKKSIYLSKVYFPLLKMKSFDDLIKELNVLINK